MADPKDKSAAPSGPPSGPTVPAIPRLTPAVPEPVGPGQPAQRPPVTSPGRPVVNAPPPPAVPQMAPLVRPPAPGGPPSGATPPQMPSIPRVPAQKPSATTPLQMPAIPRLTPEKPFATRPPQMASVPRVAALQPLPAVPQLSPLLPKAGSPAMPSARPGPDAPGSAEWVELERRFAVLDQLDYFEVMELDATANPADIKRAFHHQSRTFHPDRFFQSADIALRDRVNAVYKRVTEAYYVLRDDTRRRKYLADISGPDRLQKLRFDELAESEAKAAVKKEVAEQIGTHPKGRQFYTAGAADLEAGRLAAAERNIKLALTYEPQNPLYLQKLEEARAKSYEEYKRQGKGFRIE